MSTANNRLRVPILIHCRRSDTVRGLRVEQTSRARLAGLVAKRKRIAEAARKHAARKAALKNAERP